MSVKPETYELATQVLVLLQVLQENIDEIALDKAFFKYDLKRKANLFQKELQNELKILFNNMNEEAQKEYFSRTNQFMQLIEDYQKEQIKSL